MVTKKLFDHNAKPQKSADVGAAQHWVRVSVWHPNHRRCRRHSLEVVRGEKAIRAGAEVRVVGIE